MWKKHIKELLGCILAAVTIVILVLIMVLSFEYLEIHVPGTREMWIGLIGAISGGTFTLFGVLITLFQKEEADNEQKRLENMPILGFEICWCKNGADTILTFTGEEIITSGFPDFENMKIYCIEIKTVNGLGVFNFTVEDCVINGRKILLGNAFNPAKRRIVMGESTTFVFNYSEELKSNIFCIVRFSYEDIFGNKYYQDLPFTYTEAITNIRDNMIKQFIEIRDIKQPVLVNANIKNLEDVAKEYIDYEAFVHK